MPGGAAATVPAPAPAFTTLSWNGSPSARNISRLPPNVDPPTTILRSGCSASELAAAPAPEVAAVAPPGPKAVSSPPLWVSRQTTAWYWACA